MLPQRRSPRLKGYDYAQMGAYFITICCYQRFHLFGQINDGNMQLSDEGQIALERWFALPQHHSNIDLDVFVVMPNHIHGVIILLETSPTSTLGTIIGSYKSSVTRHIRQAIHAPDLMIWQARYHDHIIRNPADLERIREYVVYNPMRWESDIFYDKQ
jgi:putative transposase